MCIDSHFLKGILRSASRCHRKGIRQGHIEVTLFDLRAMPCTTTQGTSCGCGLTYDRSQVSRLCRRSLPHCDDAPLPSAAFSSKDDSSFASLSQYKSSVTTLNTNSLSTRHKRGTKSYRSFACSLSHAKVDLYLPHAITAVESRAPPSTLTHPAVNNATATMSTHSMKDQGQVERLRRRSWRTCGTDEQNNVKNMKMKNKRDKKSKK